MSEIQERAEDYLKMGVRTVWIVDPGRRKAYSLTGEGANAINSALIAWRRFIGVASRVV